MNFKFSNNPNLRELVITGDCYSATPPYFTILLQDSLRFDKSKVDFLFEKELSNWRDIAKVQNLRQPGETTSSIIHIYDCTKLREVIDSLYHNRLISIPDRADMESFIRNVEKVAQERVSSASTISSNQREIIKAVVDLYLESVAELNLNLTILVKLMSTALSNFVWEPGSHKPLWTHILKQRKIYKNLPEQICHESKFGELTECLTSISLFYNGHGNLETTFIRQGVGIPSLALQQSVILMSAVNLIMAKFSIAPQENELFKFVVYLALKNGYIHFPSDLAPTQLTDGMKRFFAGIDDDGKYDSGFLAEYTKKRIIKDIRNTLIELNTDASTLKLDQVLTNRQATLILAPAITTNSVLSSTSTTLFSASASPKSSDREERRDNDKTSKP